MSAIFFEVSVSRQNDGIYVWQGEPDPTAPYESQAECLADMTQADEIVSLDEALERGLIEEDPRGRTQDESFMENPAWFAGIDGESSWIFAVCSREWIDE